MNLRRMVITPVTLHLLFLLQFSSALTVDVIGSSGASAIVLTEQILQLVEQSGGCQQHRWTVRIVDIVHEILRINIALRCRQPQPVQTLFLVTGNITVIEIQLAQGILRIGIAKVGGEREPLDRFRNILWDIRTSKIEPTKLIGCVLIFLFC